MLPCAALASVAPLTAIGSASRSCAPPSTSIVAARLMGVDASWPKAARAGPGLRPEQGQGRELAQAQAWERARARVLESESESESERVPAQGPGRAWERPRLAPAPP